MSLYQKPNSPYWYYKLPVLDARGHVIEYERKSTKRKEKSEARLVERKRSKELLDECQLGHREDKPLLEVIQDFVSLTEANGKADFKNQKVYMSYVEPFCLKQNLMIKQYDRSLIRRWRDSHVREGYSRGYTNNLITFLVSVYNYADDLKLAVPLGQKFDKLKTKVDHKVRYLMDDLLDPVTGETYSEEERLLAELDPQRNCNGMASYEDRADTMTQRKLQQQFDMTLFCIDFGTRYGEASSTPRTAIDSDLKYIRIWRPKVSNWSTLRVTDRMSEVFERMLKASNSPWLFPSPIDATKHRGYSTKGMRNAYIRAGLNEPHLVERYGKFTQHCYRHTFASRCIQAGLDLKSIAELVGHTTTQCTERYSHLVSGSATERAAQIMNERTQYAATI